MHLKPYLPFRLPLVSLALSAAVVLCAGRPVSAGSLAGAYTDPRYQTAIWFGAFSHYIQPWRGYLETVPAGVYTNAIGVNFISSDSFSQCDLGAQMLAKNGVRRARVEYGWGGINYDNESVLNGASGFSAKLRALNKHGLRPLILLNCHQGVPCPVTFFNRTVQGNWPVGSRTIAFTSTNGFVLGRTGPRDLTDYWAAEALIVGLTNAGGTNYCELSKPLPKAFTNGQSIGMATLKYRPFSAPGSPDYLETIAGWQRYVGTVARFAADTLGTTWAEDKGFDVEIYNELTFGTHFLYINDYYDPDLTNYSGSSIWGNLPRATGDFATTNAGLFTGVTFCDGFANTIPWPASSTEHPRIGALSKHPYPGPKAFSGTNQPGGTAINALLGQENRTNFQPTYTSAFTDYPTTALQTETQIRDMSPITTDIYGTLHGRYARKVAGQVSPVDCWMTETGTAPNEWGVTNATEGWALKAKAALRLFPIFINKGVTALYWFNTGAAGSGNDDLWLGACYDAFLEYARTNSVYPGNDEPFTSPWLKVVGRVSARIGAQLDPAFATNVAPAGGVPRPLTVEGISDTHDHFQFAGDGTAAHPHLFNRELLAILPFQANPSRFVIAYYVQSRDMRTNLPPENYTVVLRGLNLSNATVTAYDPRGDSNAPVSVTPLGRTRAAFELISTDYPRLLIIEEAATPAPNRLKAEAGLGRVVLSWPAVAGATGYQVYRATVSGGPYTQLAAGLTNPWFLDTNVLNGTTYYYVVSARSGSRPESADSPEATAAPSASSRLVPAGAVWKYLDDGSNQGTAWRGTNFNDATWKSGSARLGYGGDGEVTTVSYGPDANAKYITTWFRHAFIVSDPAVFTNLTVRLQRDDGAVVYLNSNEVFRSNMPTGAIGYLTLAAGTVSDAAEQTWYSTHVTPGLLRRGPNVLAVEVHQVNATSSDLGFDLELVGTATVGAPLILHGPQPRTVLAGQPASLSVVADSPVPATYQWFRDGQPLAGATNATLAIPSAGAADAGLYAVEVRNAAGAALSDEAHLHVVLPPVITTQPVSQGVDAGATVTLVAGVDGTAPLAWQWSFHGTNLPGATVPPLTLSNFSAALAGPYRVVVSNAAGVVTSALANLVLNSYVTNSTLFISTGAVWNYLDNGTDQGLAWRAPDFNDAGWSNGPAPLGFGDGDERTVLRRTNSAGATNITFCFRRAFTVSNPAAFNTLAFRLLRDDGAVVYLNANEVFRSNMPEGPVDWKTFALGAVSGTDEQTFFPASTPATSLVTGTNLLAVEVHQSDLGSSDISFDLELRGQQIVQAPAFLAHPTPLTRYAGESATFTATAIGSEPLTLQWRRDGLPLPGATSHSLALNPAALTDAGAYTLRATNAAGAATSLPGTLTVLPRPAASVARTPGGLALLSPAQPGRTYTVLESSDLVHWAILTNRLATGSLVAFTIEVEADASQRFYQLRVEPVAASPPSD